MAVHIVFLPPSFNFPSECLEEPNTPESHKPPANRPSLVSFINRVYKSTLYLVYEIVLEHNEIESNAPSQNQHHQPLLIAQETQNHSHDHCSASTSFRIISSQPDHKHLRKLYQELGLFSIGDLKSHPRQHSIHVFGILKASENGDSDLPPCSMIQLFDFDPFIIVTIRLWRKLAAWTKSLPIGSCVQIRNLAFKAAATTILELNSTPQTEIFLLAAGPTAESSCQLSSRIEHLNDAEREILAFLNQNSWSHFGSCQHQPPKSKLVTLRLCPLALHKRLNSPDPWKIFGRQFGSPSSSAMITLKFNNLNVLQWQTISPQIPVNLNDCGLIEVESVEEESMNVYYAVWEGKTKISLKSREDANSTSIPGFKLPELDWSDLMSPNVLLNGHFKLSIPGKLMNSDCAKSNESLGNLTLSQSLSQTHHHQSWILCNSRDPTKFVHYDEIIGETTQDQDFDLNVISTIRIRTVLDAVNSAQIVRKAVAVYYNK